MAGLLPILTRNGIDRLCFMFTCRCTLSRTLTTDIVHGQSSTVNDISQDATPLAVSQPLPLITSRKIDYPTAWREPRQAWLESLTTVEDEKLGIIDLHPDVFATYPRIDLIHRNVMWQTDYKKVKYERVRNRAEMRGGGRKPWPQKGLGRARAGSIRSPLFKGGGISHGPRGPESFYYMLTRSIRERGLRCTLSVKFAQDDLHIIDSLDIPSEDPEYIQELIKARNWGLSVLFVDDADVMPRNIALATADIKQFNVMPVYGLNVYSMLKHETLILTLAAVERIEEKLVAEMQIPGQEMSYKPKVRN